MKKYKIFMLVVFILPMISCKKYLEKEPKLLASIKTVDQLEALINNAPLFTYQANATANYSTDDTQIDMDLYRNAAPVIPLSVLYYYTFSIDRLIDASTDAFWNNEYSKIFTANLVLENVAKVTGNPEAIKKVKADAHLIRAYSYWELANYYCLPYSAGNLNTLGLPLKKTTAYDESMKRASLKETYELILSDINQAMELSGNDVNPLQRWRASRPALEAFLSRYYLFTGDYDKCIQHANAALNSTNAQLVDFNTLEQGTPMVFPNPSVTLNYSILNNYSASKFLFWEEFYFTRFVNNSNQWNIPSPDLMSLYDTQNDMRFKHFMIDNSNRRFGVLSPATFRYCVFNDGRYLAEGPSVAEVLLNKAEAAARKGDFNTAMSAVNLLRAKRMKTIADLSASSSAEAVVKVLQERRRELPFAYRWLDIRRFSVNNDPSDDVTVTHTFFKVNNGTVDLNTTETYSLPVNSRRYMVPINAGEIANSRGQIIQNTY